MDVNNIDYTILVFLALAFLFIFQRVIRKIVYKNKNKQ